jgi:hypothetical protein
MVRSAASCRCDGPSPTIRERRHIDPGRGEQRLADLRPTGHDRECTVGEADFDRQLGEADRRPRRRRRRFEDDVHPAASARLAFQTAITNGKFHGVMAATTPIGRRTSIDV